jgi:hypothetical protein
MPAHAPCEVGNAEKSTGRDDSRPVLAGPLSTRFGRCGLPYGCKDFLNGGLAEETLPGHFLAIQQDRQFAMVAVHKLDFDVRLPLQSFRQTGGVPADGASDRALANCNPLHRTRSFRAKQAKTGGLGVQMACQLGRVGG